MTGRARSLARAIARFCTGGHLLQRQLDAEVAAGHHDAVERVHDLGQRPPTASGFSILAISGTPERPTSFMIFRRAASASSGLPDEGHRDHVDAGGQRPAQVVLVLVASARGR